MEKVLVGERERNVSNCQGTCEGRGSERVELSRGEGLSGGGGVGGARRAEFRDYLHRHAQNLICISESEDACQAVSVRHRQMLCCCCCVRLSDRSEAFWETNSITSAGLSRV